MEYEQTYGAFVDYFGDIPLKKIKTVDGYTIYACKTLSGLVMNRYIYVIVKQTPFEKEYTTLAKLDWKSIQTRSTEDHLIVPEVHYTVNEEKKQMLNDKLNMIERKNDRTEYRTSLPVEIILLHDAKKKNSLQYPDSCLFYQAIETYNCCVNLL